VKKTEKEYQCVPIDINFYACKKNKAHQDTAVLRPKTKRGRGLDGFIKMGCHCVAYEIWKLMLVDKANEVVAKKTVRKNARKK
jgi:hypothetical protein